MNRLIEAFAALAMLLLCIDALFGGTTFADAMIGTLLCLIVVTLSRILRAVKSTGNEPS